MFHSSSLHSTPVLVSKILPCTLRLKVSTIHVFTMSYQSFLDIQINYLRSVKSLFFAIIHWIIFIIQENMELINKNFSKKRHSFPYFLYFYSIARSREKYNLLTNLWISCSPKNCQNIFTKKLLEGCEFVAISTARTSFGPSLLEENSNTSLLHFRTPIVFSIQLEFEMLLIHLPEMSTLHNRKCSKFRCAQARPGWSF